MEKRKTRTKSDEDFFKERVNEHVEDSKGLEECAPGVVNNYDAHSLLKLIGFDYWTGFFTRIAHKQLKDRYGYCVVYVDTMGGAGITTTKNGLHMTGSCPSALKVSNRTGFPYDKILAVEKDPKKAEALSKRMDLMKSQLDMATEITIMSGDLGSRYRQILSQIGVPKCVSYVVIDPQGLEGVSWAALHPLLSCKGDAMVTWFEDGVWRMKKSAETSTGINAEGMQRRLDDILGAGAWNEVKTPSELTQCFIDRIIKETSKKAYGMVRIHDDKANHYNLILFAGDFPTAEKLTTEWQDNMEKRLNSPTARAIGILIDVASGGLTTLDQFGH